MIKKKIFIFIFGIIFLASLISAGSIDDTLTETRFYGKQGENLTVYDSCTIDGAACDVSYNCTFTILKPDQTTLVSQVNTTHTGDLYIYNLNSTQTQDLGIYETIVYCTNGTSSGQLTFYYDINRSGTEPSTSEGILYLVVFIIVLALFLICLNAFVNTEWNDRKDGLGQIVQINYNKYLKFVYGFLSYVFLLFIFFIGKGITQNFLFLDTAYAFFNVGALLLIVLAGPGIIVITFFIALNIATDKRNAEALKRGLPFRR